MTIRWNGHAKALGFIAEAVGPTPLSASPAWPLALRRPFFLKVEGYSPTGASRTASTWFLSTLPP